MHKRVLAFDIGIKNLAWCCGDISGNILEIRGWANENLITGETAEEGVKGGLCSSSCGKKGNYLLKSTGKIYCVKDCPADFPPLRDISGNLLKKIPKMAELKELAKSHKAETKDLKSKATLLTFLESKFCFPNEKKVVKTGLEEIHNGIQKVVTMHRELWGSCDEILLENQPSYKNPVMKSVQMMLFATLRDFLKGPPSLFLVHPGRKTKSEDIVKGDKGYADRKNASENRVITGFEKKEIISIDKNQVWFQKQAKRSDLADCCSMILDKRE